MPTGGVELVKGGVSDGMIGLPDVDADTDSDDWLAEADPVPRGTELNDPGGCTAGTLELEGVYPVPRGTELEVVGMYATMELEESGAPSAELDDG